MPVGPAASPRSKFKAIPRNQNLYLMTRLATDVSPEEFATSPASIPLRSAPMTSVVVDASCFSLPYDYSLCDALGEQGEALLALGAVDT